MGVARYRSMSAACNLPRAVDKSVRILGPNKSLHILCNGWLAVNKHVADLGMRSKRRSIVVKPAGEVRRIKVKLQ